MLTCAQVLLHHGVRYDRKEMSREWVAKSLAMKVLEKVKKIGSGRAPKVIKGYLTLSCEKTYHSMPPAPLLNPLYIDAIIA